jgi:hypothetical protein
MTPEYLQLQQQIHQLALEVRRQGEVLRHHKHDDVDSDRIKLKRVAHIKVFDDATTLVVGDGKMIYCIPPELDGFRLVDADAFVTTASSGAAPTIQVRNVTDSVDMLTTPITIDPGEFTSFTAATPAVINTANDLVATGDLIAIDVDVAGTGAKGLGVILEFVKIR